MMLNLLAPCKKCLAFSHKSLKLILSDSHYSHESTDMANLSNYKNLCKVIYNVLVETYCPRHSSFLWMTDKLMVSVDHVMT